MYIIYIHYILNIDMNIYVYHIHLLYLKIYSYIVFLRASFICIFTHTENANNSLVNI